MLKQTDFCREWKFAKGDHAGAEAGDFADATWETVIVPHTWNADDMAPGRPAKDAYIGPAWYRKRFRAARPADGGRLFLLFEAIANRSDVWVDGRYLGGRDGGFLSFRFDITDALSDGDAHVVAVKADNSFRWGAVPPESIDWERYGGMYRPVWLCETGAAMFEHKGVAIRTPRVSRASANVAVSVRVRETGPRSRALKVVHRVLAPDGALVAEARDSVASYHGRAVESTVELPKIRKPQLWSPDSPALYRVESLLLDAASGAELDRESSPLGFRWFAFDADKGFSLNGQPMKLQGVDLHQEFPGLGWACPARFHRRDIEQLKEAGLNFLRTSHYPRNERALDACDELGVLVMEEQPFWHGSLRTAHGRGYEAYIRRMMRELVEHHGNHPSIIMWNTVNEILLTPPVGEPHPDPSQRKATMRLPETEWPFARRMLSAMYDELRRADPSRPVSMIVGGNWQLNEEAGMTRLADIVGYNGGAVNARRDGRPIYDIGKELDPARISVMTEGVLNDRPGLRAQWERELTMWETCATHWTLFHERDWFCGGAMWVFADYSAKGAYRNMGMVDLARLPKDCFHFFRAMWTETPMAHISCHWDWPGQEGQERRVAVFTNCDTAELFLNGKSLGRRKPGRERWPLLPHPPMEWQVVYAPGELKVVARKGRGARVVEVCDARVTSGAPARVTLCAENDTLAADGQDVAFLTAAIVDAAGNRCFNELREIELRVSGAARLAGPTVITARGGLARFAVRSTGEPGRVTVEVSAAGLEAARVALDAGA